VFDDPDEPAKIMVGFSIGSPIVLAPPNDLFGLTITEGIEDALSAHEAAGIGAWAAGGAARMPPLAATVPSYIDCVTVFADDDKDGRRHASEQLAGRIRDRGIEARLALEPSMPVVMSLRTSTSSHCAGGTPFRRAVAIEGERGVTARELLRHDAGADYRGE
jgi:hypothetical protein